MAKFSRFTSEAPEEEMKVEGESFKKLDLYLINWPRFYHIIIICPRK